MDLLQWAVTVGGPIGTLAVGMFLIYRRDMRENTAEWKGQVNILTDLVKENIKVMTEMKSLIQEVRDDLREMRGP